MAYLNLIGATVVYSKEAKGAEAKAVDVLIEELDKRTGVLLSRANGYPKGNVPVIAIGTKESFASLDEGEDCRRLPKGLPTLKAEGYVIRTVSDADCHTVYINGADARGVMYGVGKLLRSLKWSDNVLQLEHELNLNESPSFPLRGHQLGYRPKNNAYDAWSTNQFDQYIRDLAIFGANSIEILPPRTDDDAIGPVMKVEPMEMMIQLSEIIHSYGMDTWVWYPNMGGDYSNPNTIEAELAEREHIFSSVPHIQHIFIPGSDPGDMEPEPLFKWCEQVAHLLNRYHPDAKLWLSPQVMNGDPTAWKKGFYEQLSKEPAWLGGIVFGPHVDEALSELRRIVPQKYPIRRYEDITHNFHCQYPVTDWDLSFALTLGRESSNPRPLAQKHIHNELASYAIGNLSYSEGINDDVNKFIWNDQDWNPQTPAVETLRDFARWFISCEQADGVAQGLLALENNWIGPLAANDGVEVTLLQWQQMEREASERVLNNYRFQMGLLRAYFDAYTKRRLFYETELEYRAKEALRDAKQLGALGAVQQAEQILARAVTELVAQDYRRRCEELADKLFANIGYQLTVSRHYAIAQDRGAFMDAINAPLNDARWLLIKCALIKKEQDEAKQLAMIDEVLNRINPGPGGFYDNLGSFRSNTRIDPGQGWEQDPGYLYSPRTAHAVYLLSGTRAEAKEKELGGIPLAWINHINVMLDTPIIIRYDQLDPSSDYIVKVAYVGEIGVEAHKAVQVKLTANDTYVVEENLLVNGSTVTIRESLIPREVVSSGELKLTFLRTQGTKRLNIGEIWLVRSDRSEQI
ncbi:Glycosyl hydrolase family 67 N-terminus [Paenibacillus sp. 1_12]|uniref:glycoside hydrolase family 20 zincin-like fold domain-containing protein n=1 Tax=Paenibacillus sp. 1_12 TaxID=1566278 RepID=UPI0008E2D123|nr:glycoside hydrolase family 20 zincin-like fold domain-containing protein [Paenibacillus sp. 1_12]SFL15376.1 Glycosyl hydrolase family 67 N-terminus [Paenibacillus sp. 1_12]